jgi:hypothetical protein
MVTELTEASLQEALKELPESHQRELALTIVGGYLATGSAYVEKMPDGFNQIRLSFESDNHGGIVVRYHFPYTKPYIH